MCCKAILIFPVSTTYVEQFANRCLLAFSVASRRNSLSFGIFPPLPDLFVFLQINFKDSDYEPKMVAGVEFEPTTFRL